MSVRKSFALALLLLAMSSLLRPGRAAAEGVNVAWSHCFGQGTGVQNESFACDVNDGTHVMTGSFVLGAGINQVIGLEIIIDLAAASTGLPAWWDLYNAGSCRAGSLSANFVPDPADPACPDWSHSQAVGGIANYCTISGPCFDHPTSANLVRLKLAVAVAQANARDLAAGTEYFAFHVGLDNAGTVGPGSCSGCDVPVCIVLNSINVVGKNNIGSRLLTTANAPGSNFVSWQGGGVPVGHGTSGCPAATAAHRSAWGQLKALYR
jgi:hypothetical protein